MKSRLLWLFLISTCLVVATSGVALAHADLESVRPADGARISDSPERLRLVFNEPVEAEFTPVRVFDEAGGRVDLDDARVSPDSPETLTVGLKPLPAGAYTVEYRVTSLDGHVIQGKSDFAVAEEAASAGSGEPEKQEAAPGPASEPSPTPLYAGAVAGALVGVLMAGLLWARRLRVR